MDGNLATRLPSVGEYGLYWRVGRWGDDLVRIDLLQRDDSSGVNGRAVSIRGGRMRVENAIVKAARIMVRLYLKDDWISVMKGDYYT